MPHAELERASEGGRTRHSDDEGLNYADAREEGGDADRLQDFSTGHQAVRVKHKHQVELGPPFLTEVTQVARFVSSVVDPSPIVKA